MATTNMSNNVHEHGMVIDEQRKRVRCKYCAKEVSGFSRLKQHLGGVRGDVVPCEEVPEDVKLQMRNSLLERKNETLSKEVLQLFHTDFPCKRICSNSTDLQHNQLESFRSNGKRKMVGNILFPQEMVHSHTAGKSEEVEGDSSRHVQRCIGRFFYENGIDFSATKSHSFQRMISAVIGCGSTGYNLPSCSDLKGWILREEMKEIHHYVKEVKHSWVRTGCSILLDGWTNDKGRSLINFLVDCPQGPIFLRSAEVSGSAGDVNALISLFDGVIEEVGVENVIQVVTYTRSDCMDDAGKQLMEKHRTIFWNVCAAHCINLMLEKIGMTSPTKEVLSKSKIITKFIYSHSTVLKLMRKHIRGRDLVNPSRSKSVMPFLTLENIVSEKENLMDMFSSSAWNASVWSSRTEGKRVTELVGEPLFWTEARMVLKATIPLVRALHLINGGDTKPQVGYIYETMDQAKETIKMEFKNKKAQYLPFWKIIDGIWDNYLHSPLHSAGYFLNPSLFYSSDFFADAEVASGLLCCIVRMVEDRSIQDLIVLQLDEYRAAKGAFGLETAVDQRTKVPPAVWWSLYGGQCPELQRFAVRILSQSCSGALRYDLKRSLSEQLHTNGRNSIEQQRLRDLTFVHHNLRLKHSAQVVGGALGEIDPMDDWVVEEQAIGAQNDDSSWMDSDCQDMNTTQWLINGEGPSDFQPKEEPIGN